MAPARPQKADLGARVRGFRLQFQVLGLGFEVLGPDFKVLGLGFEVLGPGFEVVGLKPRSPNPLHHKNTVKHEEIPKSTHKGAGAHSKTRAKRIFLHFRRILRGFWRYGRTGVQRKGGRGEGKPSPIKRV